MLRSIGPNDWFNVIVLVIEYVLFFFLPPRIPKSVAALVMLIGLALPLVWDHSLGTPPIDLYDTNVYPELTFADVLTWAMYPPLAYFFAYLYDKLRIRGLAIPAYLLVWAVAGTAFEAAAASFGVFDYKGWSLRYSFLVYLAVLSVTAYLFVRLMASFHRARKASFRP
ncbi:hypothetical protein [Cohnella caldifontis]|uniref:hypothetical protein n=1 Tax=Cohnella caldifontis TaxID=3027471 RepID=UPI0023EBE4BF|nr:hypothetical protein [Cohnella sp. YIM B05605]